jgi:hypothetical protein
VEEEERHAEDVIRGGLFLRPFVLADSLRSGVRAILVGRETDLAHRSGHRVGIVDLELTPEEALVDEAAVLAKPPRALREETADESGRGVVDFARTEDH